MRVAVWIGFVIAGVVVACSSFGVSEDENPSTPPATRDGSVADSPSTSSSSGDSVAPGGPADLGAFACDAGFCDDFHRANPADVMGAWSNLMAQEGDPPPSVAGGLLHLPIVETTDDGPTTRTYLFRVLSDSCMAKTVSVDFEVILGDTVRSSNLSFIAFVSSGIGSGPDPEHYFGLAVVDDEVQLIAAELGSSSAQRLGGFPLPAPGTWTHGHIEAGPSGATFTASATFGGAEKVTGKTAATAAAATVKSCRFSIGADYVAPGPASERWYDNVAATARPSQ